MCKYYNEMSAGNCHKDQNITGPFHQWTPPCWKAAVVIYLIYITYNNDTMAL